MNIGIMGGTFDPIHNGHLILAESVRDNLHLDEILFIPSARPPHKTFRDDITSPEHRLAMTILATSSNPYFHVSTIEIQRQGPSYAIYTINELKSIYPVDTKFFFILGSDAAAELNTWFHVQELIHKCKFIVTNRQGFDFNFESVDYQLQFIDTPKIDISSTDIRNRIKLHQSIKYLVPDEVEFYIRKEHLYEHQSN